MNRNSDFPKEKAEKLERMLEQEFGLFEQILELTAKQAEFLSGDDVEAFDRSLDDRQKIIDKIDGLHQERDVLMQSYVSFSNSAGGGKNETIEAALGRLERKIAECVELNDKNSETAKEQAEAYIKQIGNLSLHRKSLGKYALSVPNDPEHFDRMS